jgi:L-fuculose-phosphate aldolase
VAGRDLGGFRTAGRTLFSLGLVKASEGNLSVSDGDRLVITRTGCRLGDLDEADVLEGTLEAPPSGASSDIALHVATYRERGPGAIAHAHPAGSVPEGWVEGEPHGVYAHRVSLDEAVASIVEEVRAPS